MKVYLPIVIDFLGGGGGVVLVLEGEREMLMKLGGPG
jgi:hypothetical protein